MVEKDYLVCKALYSHSEHKLAAEGKVTASATNRCEKSTTLCFAPDGCARYCGTPAAHVNFAFHRSATTTRGHSARLALRPASGSGHSGAVPATSTSVPTAV